MELQDKINSLVEQIKEADKDLYKFYADLNHINASSNYIVEALEKHNKLVKRIFALKNNWND